MDTKYSFEDQADHAIAYVRAVKVAELPTDMQKHIDGLDTVYAVHNAKGDRLALVPDRNMAFALARQNDMAPVAVH